MRKKMLGAMAFALLGVGAGTQWVHSADHIDSAGAVGEGSADITDLFAWMNADATKVNLILDVTFSAGTNAAFSDALVYVFHLSAKSAYGAPDAKDTMVTCKFYTRNNVECWAAGEYVQGNISTGTLESASKKMRVFAGRRNDPFFFELTGFQETVKKVVAASPSLTLNANGCPALDAATSGLLVKQLQSNGPIASATESKPAKDFFAGLDVLSLAVQIDKSLVTDAARPIVGVWAATHRAM